MAKTVCKNCGHKNPASAAVCENCGSFMFEEPKQPSQQASTQAPPDYTQDEQEPEQETTPASQYYDDSSSSQQEPVTIKVSGGGAAQQFSTLSGFIILGAFFVLEYMGLLLNFYYFFVFLVLIFAVPTLIRRTTSVIRFNGYNFNFRNASVPESYPVSDIENVKIGQYDRMDQSLTINFKEGKTPLRVEFNSIMAFRSVVVAFSRRRIPIIPANAQQKNQAQGT